MGGECFSDHLRHEYDSLGAPGFGWAEDAAGCHLPVDLDRARVQVNAVPRQPHHFRDPQARSGRDQDRRPVACGHASGERPHRRDTQHLHLPVGDLRESDLHTRGRGQALVEQVSTAEHRSDGHIDRVHRPGSQTTGVDLVDERLDIGAGDRPQLPPAQHGQNVQPQMRFINRIGGLPLDPCPLQPRRRVLGDRDHARFRIDHQALIPLPADLVPERLRRLCVVNVSDVCLPLESRQGTL